MQNLNEDSAPAIGRTSPSGLPPGDGNLSNSIFLRSGSLVSGALNSLLDACDAVRRLVISPDPGVASPQELSDLESHAVHDDQVTNTGPRAVGATVTTLRGDDNPFTSAADDAAETGGLDEEGGPNSHGAPPLQPRRTWMLMASLMFMILFLIMVPGLIIGLVTRQVAWGFAISGAVAPAVVFFGSLCYPKKK